MMDKIDFFFNKLLPKKFIVFTVATIMVFQELQVPWEYWVLAYAYFGVNSILHVLRALKGGKEKGNE